VGEAPVRCESGGTNPARSPGNFFGRALHFLALKVQLVVLVSAFVIVSTVWSVSCLLFFYSRDQPFVKVGGGHVPPCPMESAPLSVGFVGHSRAYALATIITVNLKYRSTVVFYCR